MVYCFAFIEGLCLLSHKLIHLDTMICFAEVVCLGMKAELRGFYGVETLFPQTFSDLSSTPCKVCTDSDKVAPGQTGKMQCAK